MEEAKKNGHSTIDLVVNNFIFIVFWIRSAYLRLF